MNGKEQGPNLITQDLKAARFAGAPRGRVYQHPAWLVHRDETLIAIQNLDHIYHPATFKGAFVVDPSATCASLSCAAPAINNEKSLVNQSVRIYNPPRRIRNACSSAFSKYKGGEVIEELAVGIDGSPASFEAFDQALLLSRRLGCALKCVFVVDSRKTQIPYVYSGGGFDISTERIYLPLDSNLREYYARIAKDLSEFGENCLKLCSGRAKDSGIRVTTILREGYPTAELCEECKSADILVVGQKGENAHYKRSIVGSTTEDLVRTSPRPVQVVPKHRESLDKVLFVYDGSRTAENALRFYVNTLGNIASEFAMVLLGEDQTVGNPDEEIRFLKHHGVPVALLAKEPMSLPHILAAVEERPFDMILVGAYGKRKMLEVILGSTASHLIRKSTVPVLVVY